MIVEEFKTSQAEKEHTKQKKNTRQKTVNYLSQATNTTNMLQEIYLCCVSIKNDHELKEKITKMKNKQNLPTCFINLLQINYAAKLQKILIEYATFLIQYCCIQNKNLKQQQQQEQQQETPTQYI